ncbi:MAG TPA: hypothetical protein VF591_17260 [Pyrinomonadaceae bacterium]|jgi:hypothetical protein
MVDLKALTLYELLSLIISAAGFVGVIITLIFLYRQTRMSDRELRENLLVPLKTQQLELDRLFVEHPHLRKYFYDGARVPEDKPDEYAQVAATAEYILDHFAAIMLHTTAEGKPLASTIWREYMKDSFVNSPALCSTLERHRRWYARELLDIKDEACPARTEAPAVPQISRGAIGGARGRPAGSSRPHKEKTGRG